MNIPSPSSFFKEQIDLASTQQIGLKRRLRQTALLRVLVFLGGFILLAYFANDRLVWETLATLVGTALPFIWLIKRFNKLNYQLRYAEMQEKINLDELHRVDRTLQHIADDGEEFISDNHPYTSDLDIFGKSSLFKFVNRTATKPGRTLLATWLQQPTDIKVLQQRQEAVRELLPLAHWRQDFQVKGSIDLHEDAIESQQLLQWLQQPLPSVLTKHTLWVSGILALGFVACAVLAIVGKAPLSLPLLALAVNFGYIGFRNKALQEVLTVTSKSVGVLKSYAAMMQCLESFAPDTALLKAHVHVFSHQGKKASVEIEKLASILYQLETRQNMLFFAFVNLPFVYENLPLYRLNQWKRQHATDVAKWFQSLAEIDALCSLAAMGYANPDFSFPELTPEDYTLEATQIGHPLLHPKKRVDNNFTLKGQGQIALITGSNMAGKTTFERTLGVNTVLALAGAPVCARHLRLSHLEVFTSMRIKDSLEEHVSSFYAELKRFKALLNLLESNRKTFFLLDELLRGTNSEDRHDGIRAIIQQLIESNGFGLISTHDLTLAEMATVFPEQIRNYSFNSSIVEEKLHFNYKLETGKCHSFSASKLMEMMGIKLKKDV